jgi:hypothetical protein
VTKITLHLTHTQAELIRLALCNVSIASTDFVKADTLQRKIGQAAELHELDQKNIERTKNLENS